MTIAQIKKLINTEEYEFLQTNPHLGQRIVFLALGGSHAYGTDVSTSDADVRGCALNSKSDLLGLTNFEQVVNTATDTTVYSFNKLIGLLVKCNPNTIEMLGCRPDHYLMMTDIGRQMIDNRKMFLSQAAVESFGGYATQQLRRLQNAVAHDQVDPTLLEEHIKGALERSINAFGDRFTSFENSGINLYTADSSRDDLDIEVFCDIDIKKYPAREFRVLLNVLSSVVRDYEKLNHRNRKKDDNHLNKHAAHLIRLYLMCLDILEKEEIITYRVNDRELLLNIRNGQYQKEDGTYMPEFFEMVDMYKKRLQYAKENTNLPKYPNMKRIEEFVMDVNWRSLDA